MKRILAATLFIIYGIATSGAVELGEDGLHKQEWFSITFRDIADDVEAARANGKRLAIMYEQIGCSYCKEVHETVLTDPEVRAYIEANFMMVQYNLYGDEEVMDSDGEELTEKTAARKWGVLFTPTIMFMPEEIANRHSAREAAVAVMPGAFHKGTFLDFFAWVREKGYESDEDFQRFHARKIRERSAARKADTD